MAQGLTQKDAAARLGCSAAKLRRLTKAGVTPRDDDRRYPWPATREAYAARDSVGSECVTQREAALRLDITTKWLRTLTTREAVPRNDDGTYPWPDVQVAYEAFRERAKEEKSGPSDFRSEQARLARAKAEAQEMENAVRRGELIAIEDVTRMLRDPLARVNVIAKNMPSKYASRLAREAGITLAESRRILGELSESIRDELRDSAA